MAANGFNYDVNGGSPRPWVVAKFSELYLIAAEAAVKLGKNADAKTLVNVLRARAGKMTYSNNDNETVSVDKSAEMVAATPDVIDIDFILDERSREFWGEGYRWFDLVRTQTWGERASVLSESGLPELIILSFIFSVRGAPTGAPLLLYRPFLPLKGKFARIKSGTSYI